MTVNSTTSSATYQGNGVTTVFPFAFEIDAQSETIVTLVDTTATPPTSTVLAPTQYSMTGLGVAGGGTVTYPVSGSALAIGHFITIQRSLALIQSTELPNQGGFQPKVIEGALDYLTELCQQLQAQIERSLQFAVSDPSGVPTPIPVGRAGQYLTFDANGMPGVGLPVAGAVTISAPMQVVVAAASLEAALSTLATGGVPNNTFYTDKAAPHPQVLRLGDRITVGYTSATPLVETPSPAQLSWAGAATSAGSQGWIERDAALSVYSKHGSVSVASASRASDYFNSGSPAAREAYAFAGYGLADAPNSVGEGAYFEARTVHVTGTAVGVEIDSGNYANPVPPTINPYQVVNNGASVGILLGAGGDAAITPGPIYDSSTAIAITANGAKWLHGITFHSAGITGTDGVTGTGIAIQFAKGHEMQWCSDNTGARRAFVRSDAVANGMGLLFTAGAASFVSMAEVGEHVFDAVGNATSLGTVTGKVLAVSGSLPVGVPAASGFFIYCDTADNKLKARGSGGTITVLANP